MTTDQTPKAHLGRNVRHFRLENNLSQEAFADLLGAPWSQKKVSQLENKTDIDADVLEEIARVLNVSAEEIKEYSEASVVNNIQNNYDTAANNTVGPNGPFMNCTFNPLDKLIEAHEEIKKLNAALLKEKDEKIELLNRMLQERR
ncbi:MAG TPA: helix-turn-helix transcriptional regulator [Chryseolinea sp.]